MKIKGGQNLSGTVNVPPSKSEAHRALICAALSKNRSKIKCSELNDDIIATYKALNSIGANIIYENGYFYISPIIDIIKNKTIKCNESGSTLRFLISIFSALSTDSKFEGCGELPKRPMDTIYDLLKNNGISIHKESQLYLPVKCEGQLKPGKYKLNGNISSQYLTGLLFALPLLNGNSEIIIEGSLTSKHYINMTLEMLKLSNVEIDVISDNHYKIKGNQIYDFPEYYEIEGDWSSAAFWIVAGIIGNNPIYIKGLKNDSKHGDKQIIDVLKSMGANIEVYDDVIIANPSKLNSIEIDCSDIPDLVPIISVAASTANGKSKFLNVGRLRFKECNRLTAIKELIYNFGILSDIKSNDLIIMANNCIYCQNNEIYINTYNDHRIAMAGIIMTIKSNNNVEFNFSNINCINKSYTNFINDFNNLIL